jgi:hypothetical protein
MSQSPRPRLQVVPQRPAVQVALAPGGVGQRLVQLPQRVASLETLTSQPLAALMSQSPKPSSQAVTAQAPITHAGVPLGGSHTLLQRPQCVALDCTSTHTRSQQTRPREHSALVAQPPPALGGASAASGVPSGATSQSRAASS